MDDPTAISYRLAEAANEKLMAAHKGSPEINGLAGEIALIRTLAQSVASQPNPPLSLLKDCAACLVALTKANREAMREANETISRKALKRFSERLLDIISEELGEGNEDALDRVASRLAGEALPAAVNERASA